MMEMKIPEHVQKQIAELSTWIDEQEHLPNNMDERLTLRFLHSCYYDIDKAKTTAQLFFSIRSSVPELLTDRDHHCAPMQKTLKIINLGRYRISGNRNLWLSQLNDPGLNNFDHMLDAKLLFLYTDGYLLKDNFLQESDVLVMDVKDISFKFVWKLNFSIMMKVAKYQQEAMPLRLNEIHMVNTPPAMDTIYRIMKRFINQDMANKIHFHKPDSTTLFDYLNKEDLPADYGGSRGTVAEAMTDTLAMLEKCRDYFLKDDFWRHEKKEIIKETSKDSDFRSLGID